MTGVTAFYVLRVFVGRDGGHGNPLAIFVNGPRIPSADRQTIAAELGFSETVFVDDPASAVVQIFTPARELAFAGHPLVGAAWLLTRLGYRTMVLRPPAGPVRTWSEGRLRWIRASPAMVHPMTIAHLDMPDRVESLSQAPAGEGSYYAWAWADESAGVVRSRYFAPSPGIPEDEATGSAAVALTQRLQRDLLIHQGAGSQIYTRPVSDGSVAIGGRVELDDVRELSLSHGVHIPR